MAIRPLFAGMILEGRKTCELRRHRCRIEVGHRVWMYTTGDQVITGWFEVQELTVGAPKEVCSLFSASAGLARADCDRYFSGAKMGTAITFRHVFKISRPLRLPLGVRPPRSYQRIPPRGDLWRAVRAEVAGQKR
jgi:predicted transcriptional regulator